MQLILSCCCCCCTYLHCHDCPCRPGLSSTLAASAKDVGPIGFDDNNMLVRLMGDAAPPPATPPEPRVVVVSKRELTMMRSVLPSPNKHKGRKMNEEMGIRSGAWLQEHDWQTCSSVHSCTHRIAGPSCTAAALH